MYKLIRTLPHTRFNFKQSNGKIDWCSLYVTGPFVMGSLGVLVGATVVGADNFRIYRHKSKTELGTNVALGIIAGGTAGGFGGLIFALLAPLTIPATIVGAGVAAICSVHDKVNK